MSWSVKRKGKQWTFTNSSTDKTFTINANQERFKMGYAWGTQKQVENIFLHYLNTGKKPETVEEFNHIAGDKHGNRAAAFFSSLPTGIITGPVGLGAAIGHTVVADQKAMEAILSDLDNFIEDNDLNNISIDQATSMGLFPQSEEQRNINNPEYRIQKIEEDIIRRFVEKNGREPNDEELQELKFQAEKEFEKITSEQDYNPYVDYMKKMQDQTYEQELGLLTEQNKAAVQQAEIASQQMMMHNAQFKDQLIEQIKTDRMSKLRSGMSQMQIANEEMQFMVGNQMQNQQAVSEANQQLLGARQQEGMLPYQAWLQASQGVTGGQGYANFAAGMAATDASSMQMQAQSLMRNNPGMTYQQAVKKLQTNYNQQLE